MTRWLHVAVIAAALGFLLSITLGLI